MSAYPGHLSQNKTVIESIQRSLDKHRRCEQLTSQVTQATESATTSEGLQQLLSEAVKENILSETSDCIRQARKKLDVLKKDEGATRVRPVPRIQHSAARSYIVTNIMRRFSRKYSTSLMWGLLQLQSSRTRVQWRSR